MSSTQPAPDTTTMSVHRLLIENQLAITPSMEAARIERDIVELASQARMLGEMLPSLVDGDLSLESSCLLEALGYSTEAEEKKGLLTRVWEHIKKIFSTIYEKITRLFAMRKKYLEGNHFQADKLRKYINNIDMTHQPEGKVKPRVELLAVEPGRVKEEAHKYVTWAQQLVKDREAAIHDLSGIHFDLMDDSQISDARGKALHYVEKVNGVGAALVNYTINRLKIDVTVSVLHPEDLIEITPASVVMMNTLMREFDEINKIDKKITEDLAKSLNTANTFRDNVSKFTKAAHDGHMNKQFSDQIDEHLDYNKMKESLKGVSKLAEDIVALLRLSPYKVMGAVSADILQIVRASLGGYKFKKHELMEEDRNGGPLR